MRYDLGGYPLFPERLRLHSAVRIVSDFEWIDSFTNRLPVLTAVLCSLFFRLLGVFLWLAGLHACFVGCLGGRALRSGDLGQKNPV